MKHYLLIESRGSFETESSQRFLALARGLAAQGAKVEVMLVQNGVMSARAGAKAEALTAAIKAGIAIWVDDFSMRERALAHNQLAHGVRPAPIGAVIERLAAGWNVMWH